MDYQTYRDTFKGALSEDAFIRASMRAMSFIRQATFDRADEIDPETLDVMTAALVEMIGSHEREGGMVTSRTIGSESVSYKVSEGETLDGSLYAIIRRYLGGTGLLYQGVYPN